MVARSASSRTRAQPPDERADAVLLGARAMSTYIIVLGLVLAVHPTMPTHHGGSAAGWRGRQGGPIPALPSSHLTDHLPALLPSHLTDRLTARPRLSLRGGATPPQIGVRGSPPPDDFQVLCVSIA